MSLKETLKDFFWNTPKEARTLVTNKIERLHAISKPSRKNTRDLQEAYAERRALNGYGVAITALTLLLLLILLSFMVLFPPVGGPLAAGLALAQAGLFSVVAAMDLVTLFSVAAFASAVFIGAFSIRLYCFETRLIKEAERYSASSNTATYMPKSISDSCEDPTAPNVRHRNGIVPPPPIKIRRDTDDVSIDEEEYLLKEDRKGYGYFN